MHSNHGAADLPTSIEVIYQDDDLIAVNKPSGLLCVPGLSSPHNLLQQVQKLFPNARVVHRLDMSTSGLVLFALNHPTQKGLGQLFEKRLIYKEYRALVHGVVAARCGEICAPMITDWPNRPRQKVDWHQGRSALTYFEVDEAQPQHGYSALRLLPRTGRSHQLRVHLRHIGHPILGDKLYFTENSDERSPRLCLHATQLTFLHPIKNHELTLRCPIDWSIDGLNTIVDELDN